MKKRKYRGDQNRMKCCGKEMIVVDIYIDTPDFDLDLDAVTYKCERTLDGNFPYFLFPRILFYEW